MRTYPEKIIQVGNLTTSFDDLVIHDGLDFSVHRGEIVGVVGGSGTGKSVLMRTIIGLNKADSGKILVLGKDLLCASEKEKSRIEQKWGVLFQEGALFSFLTVKENILVPLNEHTNLSVELKNKLADIKILMTGLPLEASHKYPSELSGGMKKRAALARALALEPELLFLDEPTAGLDPIAAENFDKLIRELQKQLGLTVMMITHDLDSLATSCDRIAVLADKRVIVNAPLDEVRTHSHPWISAYFNGKRGRLAFP